MHAGLEDGVPQARCAVARTGERGLLCAHPLSGAGQPVHRSHIRHAVLERLLYDMLPGPDLQRGVQERVTHLSSDVRGILDRRLGP